MIKHRFSGDDESLEPDGVGLSDELFDDDDVGLEELGEEEEVLQKPWKDVWECLGCIE